MLHRLAAPSRSMTPTLARISASLSSCTGADRRRCNRCTATCAFPRARWCTWGQVLCMKTVHDDICSIWGGCVRGLGSIRQAEGHSPGIEQEGSVGCHPRRRHWCHHLGRLHRAEAVLTEGMAGYEFFFSRNEEPMSTTSLLVNHFERKGSQKTKRTWEMKVVKMVCL